MIKIVILTFAVFVSGGVFSGLTHAMGNEYIRLKVLSGVEAEVIKVAVEKFKSEKLNITPQEYEVALYLKNGDYLVFLKKGDHAPLGAVDLSYEVVISSKTLEVIHSQFSR